MKLLSEDLVNKWKIFNIHPSLLPAFAGQINLNVHQAVLDRGCKVTGCTLILVDEGADTGPIIIQKSTKIDKEDTIFSLKEKVQKLEQETLLEFLSLYQDEKIKLINNKVEIHG